MDIESLKELEYKNMELNKKIYQRNNKADDILDFYPMFKLKEPYTSYYSDTFNRLKPYQLLPFFENIIFDLKPLSTEQDFYKYYGMSLEQIMELHDKGIIHFRIPSFMSFEDVKTDYLDDILFQNPPTTLWANYYYGLCNNTQEKLNDIDKLFANNKYAFGNEYLSDSGYSDPLTIIAMDLINGNSNKFNLFSNDLYKKITELKFNKLWSCGFNEIVDSLKPLLNKGHGRLDWAYVYSTIYSSFLSDPILNSLNGTHMVDHRLKEISSDMALRDFNKMGLDIKLTDIDIKNNLFLSKDIAKTVGDTIEIPLLYTFEDYDSYDFNGPIKALKSLEDTVNKNNHEKIIDLTDILRNELYESGKIVEDIRNSNSNRKNILDKINTSVGIIGSIGSALPLQKTKPLFDFMNYSSILGSLSLHTGVTDYLLKKFSLFKKPNHVLYLYENYDNFIIPTTNVINKKSYINCEQFDDDLNQKYEYYEYLYQNIPSLKVIIDIVVEQILANGYCFYPENKEKYLVDELKIDEEMKEVWTYSKLYEMIKIQEIYGEVFLKSNYNYTSKNIKKEIEIINPKYIRPIYENNQLLNYVIINKGKKQFIRQKQIYHIKDTSYIEELIYLLDITYSDITKSIERPELLWDKIHKNEMLIKENITSEEKCIEILNDSLDIIKKLYHGNNIYTESKLYHALGCCNFNIRNFKEAIKYYKKTIELTENAKSSELLELKQKAIKMLNESVYYQNHIEETF